MTRSPSPLPSHAFVESIAARMESGLSTREHAAITQLVADYVDTAPVHHPPREREVSIVMADLRGFTALAASTDPKSLVSLLEPFFEQMAAAVHEYGGFVDKFLGDGLMAIFGAPAPCEEHVLNALRCAARMQCAMKTLNEENYEKKLPALYAGIGVNSGEVMCGTFGSQHYREYTVIGDTVNIAARMEKFSLRGEVLLSDACHRAAGNSIEVEDTREIRVRGQKKAVRLHSLRAVTSAPSLSVPLVELRTSPRVQVDLPLLYQTVENQRVLPQRHQGHILNLGYGGMLARLSRPLPELGEITFGIAPTPTTAEYEDVYARALHQQPTEDGYQTAFAFTSVGQHGHEAVRRCVDQMLWGG